MSWFSHSFFSTVDFLIYLAIAVFMFNLGKSYEAIRLRNLERQQADKYASSFETYSYAHSKLKTDEPDEEQVNTSTDNEMRELRQDLQASKDEVRTLSDELRRLR